MAEEFDAGIDVADVYAAALFELAREADAVDAVRAELDELTRLIRSDDQIGRFFSLSAVDDDDRARSLETVFRGRLSDVVLDTLQVMNGHGRLGLIPQLARAYTLRVEDARGQVEVTVTSALELDDKQRAAVEKIAEELSGRKPLVRHVVDPEVIGGLVLQIGDYRYDNSVRRHLKTARERLLERSARGLSIGAEMSE